MLHDMRGYAPRCRIFLAGGSHMVDREMSRAPMTGWGQALPLFLSPDVEVVNCARAGASARTFAERGRLAWILENIQPGDYLVIGFGGNDAKPEKWLRTEAFGNFKDYLRMFVDGARERGAHPVLISAHERDNHDGQGNLSKDIVEYYMAMSDVAVETSTPYIDMYEQSLAWWAELGPEGTRSLFVHVPPGHPNYPDGFDDPGHLVPAGAIVCARFVAYSLAAQQIIPAHWAVNLDRQDIGPESVGWLDDETHAALTRERTAGAGDTL